MNILEEIKQFYEIVLENRYPMTVHHVSLYLFLLFMKNDPDWSEWFKTSPDTAMAGSLIKNKKTYYKTLHDLVEWGFIGYQAHAPEHKIVPSQTENKIVILQKQKASFDDWLYDKYGINEDK